MGGGPAQYIFSIWFQKFVLKRWGGEVHGCKVAQPRRLPLGHLCIWQVVYQERNVDAGLLGCQGEVCGMIKVHAT